jgi:hypothetical protein
MDRRIDPLCVLAGDTDNTNADWEGRESIRHIPPAVHASLVDSFDSFDRIERFGCVVILGHDISLVNHHSFSSESSDCS